MWSSCSEEMPSRIDVVPGHGRVEVVAAAAMRLELRARFQGGSRQGLWQHTHISGARCGAPGEMFIE